MQDKIKSIYKDSSVSIQALVLLCGFLIIGFTIYLTHHYFITIYPEGLNSGGLCNVSSFFNCDVATFSVASNIAGVPISLFGMFLGIITLLGSMFYSEKLEGTLYQILKLNAFMCFVLFIYSLFWLNGLCPFCSFYYLTSWALFYLFYKHSDYKSIDLKIISILAVPVILIFIGTKLYVRSLDKNQEALKESLVKQFDSLPNLGKPKFDSEYRIMSSTKNFDDAPVRITKFSDFECPACKMLSKNLHKLKFKYQGKINIQYFFYPLQLECNPNMKSRLHEYACTAAYIASCSPQNFSNIEQYLFKNQKDFSKSFMNKLANKYKLQACRESQKTHEKIISYIDAASPFNIKSTPTFLLNGKKIEGVLPFNQLTMLIDHILDTNKKK